MSAKPPSPFWWRATKRAARRAMRPWRRPPAASAWSAAPVSSIPDGPPRPAKLKPPSGLAWPAIQAVARRAARAGGPRPAAGRAGAAEAGGVERAAGAAVRAAAGGAQAEDGEGGRVDAAGERAVAALLGDHRMLEVPAADLRPAPGGVQDEEGAVELAEVVQLARVGADVGQRAGPPDVERVASGGGEAERGPARVELRGRLVRRGAPAAVVVLGVEQVPDGGVGRGGVGRLLRVRGGRRRRDGQRERGRGRG